MRLAVGETAGDRRADARRDVAGRAPSRSSEMWTNGGARRAGRAPRVITAWMPSRSMSAMVWTASPWAAIRARSPGSRSRAPISATRSGGDRGGSVQRGAPKRSPPRPSAAASGMPWTLPLGVVCGVLRSACASIQSTAPAPRRAAARPACRARASGRRRARSGCGRRRALLRRARRSARSRPDLGEEAGARIVLRGRLGHGRDDVAAVPQSTPSAVSRSSGRRSGSRTAPCRRRAVRRRDPAARR